eukprot:325975_1
MADSSHTNMLKTIDYLIGKYYKSFKINDYYNTHNKGRFWQYIIDEGLDDEDIPIEQELGETTNPSECVYVEFDTKHFPVNDAINYHENTKRNVMFYILQHCYKFKTLPTVQYINSRLTSVTHPIITHLLSIQTKNEQQKCMKLVSKILNNILLYPKKK